MRFAGNIHATPTKRGWEFRIYSGDKYYTTSIGDDEALRLAEFINEVSTYGKAIRPHQHEWAGEKWENDL